MEDGSLTTKHSPSLVPPFPSFFFYQLLNPTNTQGDPLVVEELDISQSHLRHLHSFVEKMKNLTFLNISANQIKALPSFLGLSFFDFLFSQKFSDLLSDNEQHKP